ncbi:MAG: hypothetical protein ACJ73S_00325 [Mycobacteriales bacterium]
MAIDNFEAGDRLVLSCEPADARVAGMDEDYVFIEWPWRAIDPESRMRWDGTVALPRDPESLEWANTPWRVEPGPEELTPGSMCMVGIPRTVVALRSVDSYEPALDTGWLPRPTIGLNVVEVGQDQLGEEAGYTIYRDSLEPIAISEDT